MKKESIAAQPLAFLSIGSTPWNATALAEAAARAGGVVTSVMDQPSRPGRVEISRPPAAAAGAAARKPPEKIVRDLDLTDPRLLEPWLDNSLLGGPPPAGAVVCLGTMGAGRSVLAFSTEEMEGFLAHLGKALNAFAEAARAVREHGAVVLIVPAADTEEGHLVRAGVRQMVRTCLAEQHFLPAGKKFRVALLTAPGGQEERTFHRQVLDILSGQAPPVVEPIPVGRLRP